MRLARILDRALLWLLSRWAPIPASVSTVGAAQPTRNSAESTSQATPTPEADEGSAPRSGAQPVASDTSVRDSGGGADDTWPEGEVVHQCAMDRIGEAWRSVH